MLDKDSQHKAKLILAQAQATEESLLQLNTLPDYFQATDSIVSRVNSVIGHARQALQGSGLDMLVPNTLTPAAGTSIIRTPSLIVAVSNLRAGLSKALEEEGEETEALGEEIEVLKRKLAEAETRSLNVVDDELRDRCLDLLVRPGKADAAVREACVVLEDRIRDVAGLPPDLIGVQLVSAALKLDGGVLVLSDIRAEQEAIHALYRGAIGFFKNPTSHRIIENYDVTRARQVVGLIDLLVNLLREARKRSEQDLSGAD